MSGISGEGKLFLSASRSILGIPKLYPNLNPAAAIPVDREQIFRANEFFDQFRMTRGRERGQYVPNSKYIFVRTTEGDLMMHPNYRHPAIANGRPVLYAGEAFFENGRLKWWSNGSGNYRPDSAHAEQAGLPMGSFYTYEDVMKGRNKLRSVYRDTAGKNGVGERGQVTEAAGVQAKLWPGNLRAWPGGAQLPVRSTMTAPHPTSGTNHMPTGPVRMNNGRPFPPGSAFDARRWAKDKKYF